MLETMAVNERAILALGLLCLGGNGAGTKPPGAGLAEKLRHLQAREPMTTVVGAVLAGAAIFYAAERGKNPKVTSYYDALVYVSTNLSVGYSDIFARTPLGKVLGSALMTWGPALAARTFDPPTTNAPSAPASDAALHEVVQKLDAILLELKARAV
jgi:hypothetical protein